MNLPTLIKVLRNRWISFSLPVAAAVLVAVVVTLLSPTKYTAQTTIYVSTQTAGNNPTAAYQGSLLSEQRVKSYAELVTQDRVISQASTRVPGSTPADIASSVAASTPPDTVLLQVSATTRDAQTSASYANAVAESFTTSVADVERSYDLGSPPVVVARVFQPALTPTSPSEPSPGLNILLGLIVGLILGFACALTRERLDTFVRSTSSLAESTKLPIIGEIGNFTPSGDSRLFYYAAPHSPAAEGVRRVRTNIQFLDVDEPLTSILITSSLPGEGKTSFACNLAAAEADAGRKVVLVEADLRKPTMSEVLQFDTDLGVTSVLSGSASVNDVRVRPNNCRFDVIPCGMLPPNPTELCGSSQMARLLSGLRSTYDLVIVDSPPVVPVTDASALAAICDGTIVICRYGLTRTQDVDACLSALRSINAHLVGAILNSVPYNRSRDYGYGYYGESSKQVRHRPAIESLDPDTITYRSDAQSSSTHRPSPAPRRSVGVRHRN